MKNNKGITLIALVITIIVLLILAGVAIAMLTGENSILVRATDAKVVNEIGALKDEASMKAAEGITDYYENEYVLDTATKVPDLTKQKAVWDRVKTVTAGSFTYVDTDVTTENTIIIKGTGEKSYLKAEGTVQNDGTIKWTDTFKKTS